jgi:hypothetical protein
MSPLFAQQAAPEVVSWVLFGLAAAAALLPLLIALVVTSTRAERRRCDREHAERMRLLEAGLPVTERVRSDWARASVCLGIGLGVPVVAFAFTWLGYGDHSPDELWIAPVVVSVASVLCGAALTAYLFREGAGSNREAGRGPAALAKGRAAKPAFDPDAYDVAGRRG